MPFQTAKSLLYNLLLIDISLSGGVQTIIYFMVGTLSPLQAGVLVLNAILVILRVIKIIRHLKNKKDG